MFKTVTKCWIVSISAIFSMSAMAFAGVTVGSPAPGSTSGSPVHFVASSPSAIAMTVYVDNAAVYSVKAPKLDTSIPLAAGQHYVVVQAWDSAGAVTKFAETIIVGAAVNAGNGVAISSPANNSTVNSPIPVVASAGVPGRSITAMAVYLDNNLVFQINAANVNTKVNAGPGTHQLVVQAWDSANAIYKSSVMVTTGGTAAAA
ncbi:MAG TPA: Ig-like domain-containing protein, partial [Candidatus Angelobacter sp.]|nr:Ig-like domain-containing protein [Candidatus Angelobacter sp.]